jgi:tetratricopeptide (TPR) repeat protein
MLRHLFFAAMLLSLAGSTQAATLSDIQHQWAEANYRLDGDAQLEALESLSATTERAVKAAGDQDAELMIWDGIVKSTLAGKAGGLGALSLVKAARKSLEKALAIDPGALQGSAYTSLGALYYQVPGWPIAFGNKDKAEAFLENALAINPDGIDSNFFYGDFLVQQKRFDAARRVLMHALEAPDRPDRPIADAGRREEIRALLAALEP